MSSETIYTCDIEGCANTVKVKNNRKRSIQVVFTTDQTEGRGCNPYLSTVNIDICTKCMSKILETKKYIIASGAQGCNNYKLQEG